MANLSNVIDRLITEGDLNRNSGANSIASLKEAINIVNFNMTNYLEILVSQGEQMGKLFASQVKSFEGLQFDLLESRAERRTPDRESEAISKETKQKQRGLSGLLTGISIALGSFAASLLKLTGLKALFGLLFGKGTMAKGTKLALKLIRGGGVIGLGLGTLFYITKVFEDLKDSPVMIKLRENWDKLWTGAQAAVQAIVDVAEALGFGEVTLASMLAAVFALPGNEYYPEGGLLFQSIRGFVVGAALAFDVLLNPIDYAKKLYDDAILPMLDNIKEFFTDIKNRIQFTIAKAGLDIQKFIPELIGGISDEEYNRRLRELQVQYGIGTGATTSGEIQQMSAEEMANFFSGQNPGQMTAQIVKEMTDAINENKSDVNIVDTSSNTNNNVNNNSSTFVGPITSSEDLLRLQTGGLGLGMAYQ